MRGGHHEGRGCAALEDTCSGRWCRRRLHRFTVGTDATRHVRQQRVGHDTHILPLPPDERQQGAACEGEGRRRERRGRGVFCPPRERLAGRRVAAEGARKKMIYRGGHPFLVETEKSRVGLEAGRRHRLLAFLFFFNF